MCSRQTSSPQALGLLWLVASLLAGCEATSPPPPDDGRARRIERLRLQVDAGPEILRKWGPWYDALERINRQSEPMQPLWLAAGTEKPVYDDGLIDLITDPTPPGDPSIVSRPLPVLLDVARQLRERGIDFLVVPVPPRSVVYPREILPDLAPLAEGELPPLLDWRLRSFYLKLEEGGVEVLDLLPAFLAARTRRLAGSEDGEDGHQELLYMKQDPHWSPYGAEVAARVISDRVARYPWFGDVVVTHGQAQVEVSEEWKKGLGAIGKELLKQGRIHRRHRKEWYRAWRARIAGERWSLKDRSSPILILGDSYAVPAWTLPDHLLIRLRLRLDFIAVAGGLQTAQLRALNLRPEGLEGKRLVIWEFCAYSLNNYLRWESTDLGPASPERRISKERADRPD